MLFAILLSAIYSSISGVFHKVVAHSLFQFNPPYWFLVGVLTLMNFLAFFFQILLAYLQVNFGVLDAILVGGVAILGGFFLFPLVLVIVFFSILLPSICLSYLVFGHRDQQLSVMRWAIVRIVGWGFACFLFWLMMPPG